MRINVYIMIENHSLKRINNINLDLETCNQILQCNNLLESFYIVFKSSEQDQILIILDNLLKIIDLFGENLHKADLPYEKFLEINFVQILLNFICSYSDSELILKSILVCQRLASTVLIKEFVIPNLIRELLKVLKIQDPSSQVFLELLVLLNQLTNENKSIISVFLNSNPIGYIESILTQNIPPNFLPQILFNCLHFLTNLLQYSSNIPQSYYVTRFLCTFVSLESDSCHAIAFAGIAHYFLNNQVKIQSFLNIFTPEIVLNLENHSDILICLSTLSIHSSILNSNFDESYFFSPDEWIQSWNRYSQIHYNDMNYNFISSRFQKTLDPHFNLVRIAQVFFEHKYFDPRVFYILFNAKDQPFHVKLNVTTALIASTSCSNECLNFLISNNFIESITEILSADNSISDSIITFLISISQMNKEIILKVLNDGDDSLISSLEQYSMKKDKISQKAKELLDIISSL